jgi:hypothetical protein
MGPVDEATVVVADLGALRAAAAAGRQVRPHEPTVAVPELAALGTSAPREAGPAPSS